MSTPSSRREFIKQVGVGAAAVSAGLAASSTSEAKPQTSIDGASVDLLDAALLNHLEAGGIAIVASHAALPTTLAKQLALGKERAS
jgi:hypothetical protein